MTKFEDFPLVMFNKNKIVKKLNSFLEKFNAATNELEAYTIYKKYRNYMQKLSTDSSVIMIRFSLNTKDEEVKKANDLLTETMPFLQDCDQKFVFALLNSKYRPYIENKTGSYLFKMYENSIKTFNEKIIPNLIEEKQLTDRYDELIAGAKIAYNGGTYNIPQMAKFTQDKDREVRKNSSIALYSFLSSIENELADIYDKLVQTRTKMAHELGFKNYIELGYLKLGRLDYDADDVKKYREQIASVVTKIATRLNKERLERVQIKKPAYYDGSINFLEGNPVPNGDEKELVQKASVMYHSLAKETGEFFDFMVKNHLMDLSAREGKTSGGFMCYLPAYKCPFIFANFNHTSGDVDVLTHEFGHAFQTYMSSAIKVPEYQSPTLEACEIHSMSMEFFAYPYMKDFFDNPSHYYKSHLEGAIAFLPYGATVDEFQHYVYENPNATHQERCQKWLELEKKYTPYKINDGCDYLTKGQRWMLQSHIFQTPFYYIDYTLAQVVAFEFFIQDNKNHERAWKKYVKLCKMGGKYPFVELLNKAHLKSPFIDGTIKKIMKPLLAIDKKISK